MVHVRKTCVENSIKQLESAIVLAAVSGFLGNEPDMYSVDDLIERYIS